MQKAKFEATPSMMALALFVSVMAFIPVAALGNKEANKPASDGDALSAVASNRDNAGQLFIFAAACIGKPDGHVEENSASPSDSFLKAAKYYESAADQYQHAASNLDEATKDYEDAAQAANNPAEPDNNFASKAEQSKSRAKIERGRTKQAYKDAAAELDKAAKYSSGERKAQATADAAKFRELAIHVGDAISDKLYDRSCKT